MTKTLALAAFLPLLASTPAAAEEPPRDPRAEWLAAHAARVKSIDLKDRNFADLQPLAAAIGDARIVMLGEVGHGDGSSFRAKARLVRFLYEEMGFDVLAFESGLYDCRKAWQLLEAGEDARAALGGAVFAIWSRSEQVRPLFEFVGKRAKSDRPLEIAGVDPQFTGTLSQESFAADLEAFLKGIEAPVLDGGEWPAFRAMLQRLTTVDVPDPEAPDASALEAFFRTLDRVQAEVRGAIEAKEAEEAKVPKGETSFWLQVLDSTRAYAELSWVLYPEDQKMRAHDVRDEQMGKNLLWLAREAYPGRKIVVWAASRHIVANIDTIERGLQPGVLHYPGRASMGNVARKALGDQVYTVAFLSSDGRTGLFHGRGTNLLVPADPGTLDGLFRQAGFDLAFLDLRKIPAGGEWLHEPIVARPMGYVLFRADWTRAFDGFFFIRYMVPATAAPEPPARRISPGAPRSRGRS